MKVKAHVVLEFENGHAEAVTVDGLKVLGSWVGETAGQGRPIFEVVHPQVNGVYQHHNVGVALLDLLRVAIIDLNPEWCKGNPAEFRKLLQSVTPTLKDGVNTEAMDAVARNITEGKNA